MAAADQLSSLMNLISGIQGKSSTTKTSGGTSTQQANVSDAGVSQLLNQILSGSGGVKDIGTRARGSGLYNSTTEQNLLQNLYSTAANQAELARTPTVTTTAPQTQTTKAEGAGLGTTAGLLGATFLGSTALNALSPVINSGANSIGSAISDLLGISGSGNGSGSSTNGKSLTDLFGIDVGGSFGGGGGSTGSTAISTGEGYGLNTSTLGSFNTGSSGIEGAKGITFGMDLDSGSSSANVGGLGALSGLAGAAISGLLGGGGMGGSSGGGSSGGNSIICTALMHRNLLDADHYAKGEQYINSVPYAVKVGYYSWAQKVAKQIREGHEGWTKVCLPFARSRTGLLATNGSIIDHIKYPLGSLTKFIGEPVCGLIGIYLIRKAVKTISTDKVGV